VLALSMSFVIGFSSCTDEEGDGGTTPEEVNKLIGAWNMTSMDYSSEQSIEIFGFPAATTEYVGTASNMTTTITFEEEPNNARITGTYDLDVEGTTAGQSQSEKWEDVDFISNGTWVQNGDAITVTHSDGTTSTLTVTELTETSLTVSWDYTTEEEDDTGFFSIKTTTIATTSITFSK
ncbi:MAG: lipocalin family protein, partial [Saprospiraceae bacterium]